MRIEGQDPLLKLLQELNQSKGPAGDKAEERNTKEVLKIVQRNLLERDEVQLHGMRDALEVHYTRRPEESPESYFQRISAEISKRKEPVNEAADGYLNASESLQEKMTQAALYHELGKYGQGKMNPHPTPFKALSFHQKSLRIVAAFILISIILYIVFHLW